MKDALIARSLLLNMTIADISNVDRFLASRLSSDISHVDLIPLKAPFRFYSDSVSISRTIMSDLDRKSYTQQVCHIGHSIFDLLLHECANEKLNMHEITSSPVLGRERLQDVMLRKFNNSFLAEFC